MSDQLDYHAKKQIEILSSIQGNMHRVDFLQYMSYCVNKWKRLEVDIDIIDSIMTSICKQWNISKKELIENKKFAEPRSMMYYIIKKNIKLSYGEIGDMFRISKSYVKKSYDDIAYVLENPTISQQKTMVNDVRLTGKNQQLIMTARGNPEDKSVLNARRVLMMRGISWEDEIPKEEKDLVSIFQCIQTDLSEKSIIAATGEHFQN
jgi:hypothetical protein